MTKEEWIKVRQEPYIPLGVWFSYYRETGGIIDDPVEFESRFEEILQEHPILYNNGTLVHITFETARGRLYNYYDLIFGL